jgi:hypothetical protein
LDLPAVKETKATKEFPESGYKVIPDSLAVAESKVIEETLGTMVVKVY